MPRSKHPENVSPYTGLRVPVCKGTYMQEGGGLMLQGHTTAIVPCGNPTPKKLPTGGGELPTFRTARTPRAQRTVRPHTTVDDARFQPPQSGRPPANAALNPPWMPWLWIRRTHATFLREPLAINKSDAQLCNNVGSKAKVSFHMGCISSKQSAGTRARNWGPVVGGP